MPGGYITPIRVRSSSDSPGSLCAARRAALRLSLLRLGYLVVPDGLVDAFAQAAKPLQGGSGVLEQAAVAAFLAEGYFARHLRRMRGLYAARRNALARELTKGLADASAWSSRRAGCICCCAYRHRCRTCAWPRALRPPVWRYSHCRRLRWSAIAAPAYCSGSRTSRRRTRRMPRPDSCARSVIACDRHRARATTVSVTEGSRIR